MVELRSVIPPAHPLRIGYRELMARWRLRRNIAATGVPEDAIYFPLGGLGDDLLGSALALGLQEQGRAPVWMLSNHPDLFTGLSAVSTVISPTEELACLLARRGTRIRRTPYTANLDGGSRHAIPREHIIAAMARQAGFSGSLTLRPHMHLSDAELASADVADNAIVLQSSGRGARFHIPTKEWPSDRFVQVAQRLSRQHKLIQVGTRADPLLPGCIDLRGRTTRRETASLLARAKLFVGLVGFLMHVARAVDCRSVIVYGGREAPWQSGYSCNENITSAPPCSPCWLVDGCDHNHQCMRSISADEVVAAVDRALSRAGEPLAADRAEIHCG